MLLLRKICTWHLQGLLGMATATKDKEVWRHHSGWGSEVEKKIQEEDQPAKSKLRKMW